MNDKLNEKLVELLTDSTKTKADIAQLLVQNDVDISDEDLDEINRICEEQIEDDKDDIPYQLSEDKQSILLENTSTLKSKDMKQMFVKLPTKEEARFLEDLYYQTQNRRIVLQGQIRSLYQEYDSKSENENNNEKNESFLYWNLGNMISTENNIKRTLEAFSDRYYLARWAKSNIGIGPVISTVLAANLEVKDGMHAGNWWSYCGLNDNNRPWLGKEKSKEIVNRIIEENDGILDDTAVAKIAAETKWKISWLEAKAKDPRKGWKKDALIKACSFVPYNRHMKVLMYKIGHSFTMIKNNPDSLYGRLLRERLDYENVKNARGDYAEQALEKAKKVGKSTVAYKFYSKGMLPPAHIIQRCERYVTKIFMSHLFEAAWYNKYGTQCPEPYIIGFAENGHNDYIAPEVPYDSIPRDAQ